MRTLLHAVPVRRPLPAKLKGWALEAVLLLTLFGAALVLTAAVSFPRVCRGPVATQVAR